MTVSQALSFNPEPAATGYSANAPDKCTGVLSLVLGSYESQKDAADCRLG